MVQHSTGPDPKQSDGNKRSYKQHRPGITEGDAGLKPVIMQLGWPLASRRWPVQPIKVLKTPRSGAKHGIVPCHQASLVVELLARRQIISPLMQARPELTASPNRSKADQA